MEQNENKNKDSIDIREMNFHDLLDVFYLGEQLFTAEKWPNLYRTWDEYMLLNLFTSEGEFCLVAEHKGRIVGFTLGSIIDKRRSAWVYGYLEWIGVSPEMKNYGLGRLLLDRLTELFIQNGARMMMVDTEEANEGALKFFRKSGFDQENKHIYLTRNLSQHPKYIAKKKKKNLKKHKSGDKTTSSKKIKSKK